MADLAESRKLSFVETVKTFPRSFWMCCGMEMWERLAYYGTRVVLPIYICQADDPGGLHFTQGQKATIYSVWAIVASGIPMISGGFADRYGYKKTIAVSASINVLAYVLMGTMRTFPAFFAACLLLALGTALFKPGLQGTLAQSTNPGNSSVGWGLFYWLVNVGAAIGPPFAGFMHGHGWKFVFFGCAAITCLNFLMLTTYPQVESGADKTQKIGRVAIDTITNFFEWRLIVVILLFSGFWMTLYQLWDFMPNFYADWIDSSDLVRRIPFFPDSWLHADPRGMQLKQENALNLNAVLIVLFVVPMSYVVRRLRVLTSITIGIGVASAGTLIYGTSTSVWALFLGIAFFSAGEMLTGPKKTEYFSRIAPPGKKALYLGYVNIPVAIGQALGAQIVGAVYGKSGEKATLALRYLAEKTDYVKDKGAWNGDIGSLADFVGLERAAATKTLGAHLHLGVGEVNELLWTTYHPYSIWYIFAATGLFSMLGMVVFSRASRKWASHDV